MLDFGVSRAESENESRTCQESQRGRTLTDYPGTEHLSLGLVATGDGLAATLLRERNVAGPSVLRREMVQILNDDRPNPPGLTPT